MVEQPDGLGVGTVAGLLREHPPMDRELPGFDPAGAPAAPGPLFVRWLLGALTAEVPDAQVGALSTVDEDGLPDARMLVLRDVDADGAGWLFAADADSPKGRQLAATPAAAWTFYWPQLGRQVRIRGTVEAAAPELSAAEFLTRSPAARAAALGGPQSAPIGSLAAYDTELTTALARLADDPSLIAPGHTVYTLRATAVEFWQGDRARRHVRLRYDRPAPDAGWGSTLLRP
ncbi:pyridoxal 5'-phosphate synthase [Kitasatospora sp. NPDC049258]|uniref:pyridoxine/pyridoxamine 5'-phosphate oxidase n=1 Tax=Kitasatospora sp. NPDC049258 TaxID=3155394 RepID=UPI0034460C12